MKKLTSAIVAASALCAAPAFAADLPSKAPIYKAPPIQMWSWTGFYAGVYAGVGLNRSHGLDPVTGTVNEIEYLGTGFTGGATVGYNWQFAPQWVAGIEGDFGWLGLDHNSIQYNEADLRVNSKTSWIGTLRGRFGYSSGPTLTYITGGAAWVHFTDVNSQLAGVSIENSKTRTGFAVGSGVETRLGSNWTVKSESLYVDVGAGDPVVNPANFFTVEADKHRYLVQRFGVNYLFGAAPSGTLAPGNWQGFFVGAIGGSAATQTRVSSASVGTLGELGDTGTGFSAGLIVGYNWQFAPQWVAGIEGDFSWLGINHSINDFNDPAARYNLDTRWLATARARLGYSTGPALLYVTGGGAWLNYQETWTSPASTTASSTKTLSGYTVGGGIETMFGLFGPNWMTRSEYLYVNVGDGDTLIPGATFHVIANHQFHLFRSALVYRFGG